MPTTAFLPTVQVFTEDTRDQATAVVIAALSVAEQCKSSADANGHFRVHFGDIVTNYPGYPAPDARAQFITNFAQLASELGLTMIGGSDPMGYAFQMTT